MKKLTEAEITYFLKLFAPDDYFVLGMSTPEFTSFCESVLYKYVLQGYFGSTKEKLKLLMREESAETVIKLMVELMDYAIATDEFFEMKNHNLVVKCKSIIDKYNANLKIENFKVEFNSEYIDNLEKQMFKNVEENPTEAIGQAKDFIESCCKCILEYKKIPIDLKWDINQLAEKALGQVKLLPKNVDPNDPAQENLRAILGNLKAIPNNIAQLRNKYGSGHGKGKTFKALEKRHAKLAVSCAISFVSFVWETFCASKRKKQ